MKRFLLLFIFLYSFFIGKAEDGYRLWLRYDKIKNEPLLQNYISHLKGIKFDGASATLSIAKNELSGGLEGLLGKRIKANTNLENHFILCVTLQSSYAIRSIISFKEVNEIGLEGFLIKTVRLQNKNITVICAPKDIGVLYGIFHFL